MIQPIPAEHGYLAVRQILPPAAGTVQDISPPFNLRVRVHAVSINFTTDANVATRQLVMQLSAGAIEEIDIAAQTTQTASLTYRYMWLFGLATAEYTSARTGYDLQVYIPATPPYLMKDVYEMRILAENMQATDAFTSCHILTESWIEP